MEIPGDVGPPNPVLVRVQTMPPNHYFAEHAHGWNQLVYAISGVLTVAVEGSCLVVAPEEAVWLPTGTPHRVSSLRGAEFRSLYVADDPASDIWGVTTVFSVSTLLRVLIIEAAARTGGNADGDYNDRVLRLILDQLPRLERVHSSLPWPRRGPLLSLCEALYATPADPRELEEWGRSLGMSGRTLARHFERELGTTLRDWRRRLRVLKAVEMLGSGCRVTETALELGYSSTSAFSHMFRTELGQSPREHRRSSGRPPS